MREDRFGGELGDWAGKRRRLEERYAIETWSCYGTADFGLIGFERRGEIGYRIHGDCYVQICDPGTGHPLPPGESGEIVVTTLARGWPMIRFGTGDVSVALELLEDGGISWIAPLQGRVGAAVKVREIFIYPAHAERLVREIDGIARTAFTVSRNANRDEITGLVAWHPERVLFKSRTSCGRPSRRSLASSSIRSNMSARTRSAISRSSISGTNS